jgi:hypothetical protein
MLDVESLFEQLLDITHHGLHLRTFGYQGVEREQRLFGG